MNLRDLRHHPRLRGIARQLPVIGAYERRIAELTEQVHTLAAQPPAVPPAPAELGVWVPPGHFYSPFPDLAALRARRDVYDRDPLDVPAVDLGVAAQWELLDVLEPFTDGVAWPATQAEAAAAGVRYFTGNPAFAGGDALFLRALLVHLRPAQLVEFGSGYSSLCTLDTRDLITGDSGGDSFDVTFLDPYPELLQALLRPADLDTVTILPIGTEQIDLDALHGLAPGDVLFVDSTHVSKPGSDVNRLFFEILPALRPGVVVHLHDIFPAFEYPQAWVEELRGWNELYLLRAFLQYNAAFEVLLWPRLLWTLDPGQMVARFPVIAPDVGGSIWLRKRA